MSQPSELDRKFVEVTQQDLRNLQNRQAVAKTSTTDNGHQHGVTFTPM